MYGCKRWINYSILADNITYVILVQADSSDVIGFKLYTAQGVYDEIWKFKFRSHRPAHIRIK